MELDLRVRGSGWGFSPGEKTRAETGLADSPGGKQEEGRVANHSLVSGLSNEMISFDTQEGEEIHKEWTTW